MSEVNNVTIFKKINLRHLVDIQYISVINEFSVWRKSGEREKNKKERRRSSPSRRVTERRNHPLTGELPWGECKSLTLTDKPDNAFSTPLYLAPLSFSAFSPD